MRARLIDHPPRRNHQGFVIFPPSSDKNYDVMNEKLPALLDDSNYQKLLLAVSAAATVFPDAAGGVAAAAMAAICPLSSNGQLDSIFW